MSTDAKNGDRGDQLFDSFARSNEPPKTPPSSPPPDGGNNKAPDPRPAPTSAPYMSCSECRADMRDRYFALNERPICAKCRPEFAKRIQRGTGSAAFHRAFLHGLFTALVGAAILGTGVLFIPFVRIFVVIAVGHFIGKRIMGAVDGYGGRRYQWLAVGLTWFAIGLGSLVPAINEAREAADRHRAIQADTTRRLVYQTKILQQELDAFRAEQAGTPTPTSDVEENDSADDSAAMAEESPVASEPTPARKPGSFGLLDLLIGLVALPIMAMFTFGYTAAAVGLFTFGYALREAWKRTDGQGLVLELRGPFRVGTGPIPPAS